MTLGRYMTVEPVGTEPRETWLVKDRRGAMIAIVDWYAPWRCYVLTPDSDAVFSPDCLRELAAFCERAKDGAP